jgi:hypothetical protein
MVEVFNVSYFDSIRDYDNSLIDFIEKLRDSNSLVYHENWNDFSGGDIGEAILKLLASYSHEIDMYRSYYLDNLYLPSSEKRANEQINEMLNMSTSFTRSMVLTVVFMWKSGGNVGFIDIPRYMKLKLDVDGIEYPFLVMRRSTYSPDSVRLFVDIVLGDIVERNLIVREVENGKIFISERDVDLESVELIVDGVEWGRVNNIFYVKDKNRKYSISREDDGVYVYLYDGWENDVPSNISDISLRAVEVRDMFDLDTKTPIKISIDDILVDSFGNDVSSSFDIVLTDSLGVSKGSVVENNRILVLEDYEREALSYGGILSVKAYNWGGRGIFLGIDKPNVVRLVIAGDRGIVSDYIKRGLKEYILSLSLQEIDFDFIDPIQKKIDLKLLISVGEFAGTVFESDISQNIRRDIIEFMSVGNIEIGKMFNKAEMLSVISRSDRRIKFVEIANFGEIFLLPNEIISLGNLIVDFNVGSEFIYEVLFFEDNSTISLFSNDFIVSEDNINDFPLGYYFSSDLGESVEYLGDFYREIFLEYSFYDVGNVLVNIDYSKDELYLDDYVVDITAYILGIDDWYWDLDVPDGEYFEKEFYDNIISLENMISVSIYSNDDFDTDDIGYVVNGIDYFTDMGEISDSFVSLDVNLGLGDFSNFIDISNILANNFGDDFLIESDYLSILDVNLSLDDYGDNDDSSDVDVNLSLGDYADNDDSSDVDIF